MFWTCGFMFVVSGSSRGSGKRKQPFDHCCIASCRTGRKSRRPSSSSSSQELGLPKRWGFSWQGEGWLPLPPLWPQAAGEEEEKEEGHPSAETLAVWVWIAWRRVRGKEGVRTRTTRSEIFDARGKGRARTRTSRRVEINFSYMKMKSIFTVYFEVSLHAVEPKQYPRGNEETVRVQRCRWCSFFVLRMAKKLNGSIVD